MRSIMNLAVIIVIGVIIADLVTNVQGTKALLNGTIGIWQTGVNGMLGKTS
jgi:hypothetical protein